MCDEIKDTLNLRNVFYHSIQDPSPSLFLKVVGPDKVHRYIIYSCHFLWMWTTFFSNFGKNVVSWCLKIGFWKRYLYIGGGN